MRFVAFLVLAAVSVLILTLAYRESVADHRPHGCTILNLEGRNIPGTVACRR